MSLRGVSRLASDVAKLLSLGVATCVRSALLAGLLAGLAFPSLSAAIGGEASKIERGSLALPPSYRILS